ncbi:hypothetical protein Pmar_PMAR029326 [Perkinsus marinus ATCC 50983]|uniref:Uncharacterized protein n=1 Tax=Perkinsus marinus (strain ATCC 50983 / TXsc) TaxID=423536 RepID=C5KMU8_PERM5|nr:hypothetical protein Pmar_PMAR029326 [Perkinsus marinus ATCC 50983]EER14256.1 hypothetical protein Pmar_PMAR029326 [Perkinsus marinus ATCC 50983]|eukprot:XP_002782461.1 hypothetical protein Pmar_PMAR029326 [Perkinsus marinus ATCC 50983]
MTIQNTTDDSLKNITEKTPSSSLVVNSDTANSDSDSSVSTPRAEGSGKPDFGPVPKVEDLLSRVKNFLSAPATTPTDSNCDPEVVRDEVLLRNDLSQPAEEAVEIDVTAGVFDVQGDATAVEEEMKKKNVPVVGKKDESKLIEEIHSK